MKSSRNRIDEPARPKQDTPDDLVARLLATIRGKFCADMTAVEWAKATPFLRRNVVLWPASFICNKHQFTLPGERYESIMRGIFQDIIRKGNTGAVKYWPGYLMHCVQQHWNHHWEDYYAEAKSVRNLAEAMTLRCKPGTAAQDQTVEALALAHAVLTRTHHQKRQAAAAPAQKQLNLFGS